MIATTLSNLSNAYNFAYWLSKFKLKLSGEHDVDDVDGPVMVNALDGTHIEISESQWLVTVENDSRSFDDFVEAALWLWNVHALQNWQS